MKTASLLIALVTAAILTGCTTSDFTPYQGAQDWPTAKGTFVDARFALPVYYGPPPRPYTVLGQMETGNARSKRQNLAAATDRAKAMGADAIIVLKTGSSLAGLYSLGSGLAASIDAVESTVAVIKWK